MRAVPCQEEVDILAFVFQLRCEVEGHGEGRVAVDGTMTDIPVRGYGDTLLTDLLHGVEQIFLFLDLGRHCLAVLGSGIVGEVGRRVVHIAELVILATGLIACHAESVEGRNRLQRCLVGDIVQIFVHVEASDILTHRLGRQFALLQVLRHVGRQLAEIGQTRTAVDWRKGTLVAADGEADAVGDRGTGILGD